MSKTPDVVGGLALACIPRGNGWYVIHAETGVTATHGFLRQKRFAVQARADLLATGVDFTASPKEIGARREEWAGAYRLWRRRADQDSIDLVTGEHYSWSTHYGQVIPSEAHAKRIAEALAAYAWS